MAARWVGPSACGLGGEAGRQETRTGWGAVV